MERNYNKIAKFATNGIKSIKNKMEIDFLANPKSANFPYEGSVKAFYGENGSGKTAIIHSFDILFKLMNDENYLASEQNQKTLSELLNKESDNIELYISFLVYQFNKEELEYSVNNYRFIDYSISLAKNKFGQFFINAQSLEVFKKSDLKKAKKPLYKFVSNEENVIHNETSSILNAKLQNQLLTKSFTSLLKSVINTTLVDILKKQDTSTSNDKSLNELIEEAMDLDKDNMQKFKLEILVNHYLIDFLSSVKVFVGEEDEINSANRSHLSDGLTQLNNSLDIDSHSVYIPNFDNIVDLDERIEFQNLISSDIRANDVLSSKFVIKRESKDRFEKDMNYRTEIIRLFKPDIQNLSPYYTDISEKNKYIIANIAFDYGDYVVPLYLESSGTKKLFEFADSIKDIFNGGIVIYDELDSGLHDVILSRLVEFVSENCIGQLIFTTHNLAPMEVLESKKDSIDFINAKQEIVKWVKRGNSKAINFYRSGKVKGIPHNLSADDFLRILGKEEQGSL